MKLRIIECSSFCANNYGKLHTPLEKIRQTISTCTQTKETTLSVLSICIVPRNQISETPITSCPQNAPLPPKQVEEEPQYKDGQYFSSIGINIKICGKANQANWHDKLD